ncbi:MAG: M20 family metallopeptidase [Clostridiaceae bacterium]|nr:M20 family metallopeptidase [Clostridiaceae bacterium]
MFNPSKFYRDEEVIELCKNLISIPSHNKVKHQEKRIAEHIYKFAMNNNLDCQLHTVVDKRKNVIITIKGKGTGKSLMFNGHTDTIGIENMVIHPFNEGVRDGFVWGRGAVDMKGPIASILMTLVVFKRAGIVPDGDIIFTGVIGEEGNSEGTEDIIKRGITADAAIVGEPSNYEYAVGHRGLEWFDIEFIGRAAHSGRPHDGINAIDYAVEFLYRIKRGLVPKLKNRISEFAGKSDINIGTINGGIGQSTVADRCVVKLDRRYIPGETIESVMEEFQQIIDDIKRENPQIIINLERSKENSANLPNPPLITPMNEPIVHAVQTALREVLDFQPKITLGRGWTDAALLSHYANIPTVVIGPGNIESAHTKDEKISIEDLINGVEIYSRIIDNFSIKDKIMCVGDC